MIPDGLEMEVLREIRKRLVIEKSELVEFLKNKVENPFLAAELIAKNLKRKGLITFVSPIGETCYAITKKGMRESK